MNSLTTPAQEPDLVLSLALSRNPRRPVEDEDVASGGPTSQTVGLSYPWIDRASFDLIASLQMEDKIIASNEHAILAADNKLLAANASFLTFENPRLAADENATGAAEEIVIRAVQDATQAVNDARTLSFNQLPLATEIFGPRPMKKSRACIDDTSLAISDSVQMEDFPSVRLTDLSKRYKRNNPAGFIPASSLRLDDASLCDRRDPSPELRQPMELIPPGLKRNVEEDESFEESWYWSAFDYETRQTIKQILREDQTTTSQRESCVSATREFVQDYQGVVSSVMQASVSSVMQASDMDEASRALILQIQKEDNEAAELETMAIIAQIQRDKARSKAVGAPLTMPYLSRVDGGDVASGGLNADDTSEQNPRSKVKMFLILLIILNLFDSWFLSKCLQFITQNTLYLTSSKYLN